VTEPSRANVVPLRREGPLLADRDDDALMMLASSGRRDAFRILVERHARRVVRYCARMTGDARTAEELAQDTWLAVWANRETYKPSGQFVVWVLVAARNRCLNKRRNEGRRARVLVDGATEPALEMAAEDPAQLDALIANEESRRIRLALAELPAPMREALVLRYSEALAYEQIAEVTGANTSTVRSRVFHGLKKLHDLVKGGGQ
jgi:RNA polymerase sigma-70 factor, ECF subfamily